MVKYRNSGKEILQKLADKGYTSYVIRQEQIIPESTMARIRHNRMVNVQTLGKIARLLECKLDDILINTEGD